MIITLCRVSFVLFLWWQTCSVCSQVVGTNYRIGYLWEEDGVTDSVVIQTLFGTLTTNISIYRFNDTPTTYEIQSYNDIRNAQIILSTQYARQDLIVAAPVECSSVPSLLSALQRTSVPTILMTYTACPHDVIPDVANDLPIMLHDVILELHWTDIVVIHDSFYSETAHNTNDLLHYHVVKLMEVTEGSVMTSSDAISVLWTLHEANPSLLQFLVLCSLACEQKFLMGANEIDALTEKQGYFHLFSQWVFVSNKSSQELLIQHTGELTNVLFVHDGQESRNAMQSLRQNLPLLFAEMIKYVNSSNSSNSSGVTQVADAHSARTVDLRSAVWVLDSNKTSRSRELALVASWDGSRSLRMYSALFPHKNHGFNQKLFRVVTNIDIPWVRRNHSAPFKVSGICIDMLHELSRDLNFTYVISEPVDLQFGVERTPGNWSGSVGMLQRKEAELVASALSVTSQRQTVVEFTVPFYVDHYTVAYKKVDPQLFKYRLYIEPFRWQVWACIVLSLFITTTILFMVHRHSAYYPRPERRSGLGRWPHSLWYSYGAMVQQGAVHQPLSMSGRWIVGFWWMFTIILIAVYTGNLIAFLTVNVEFPPFTTIDGLISHSGYKFGFQNGTYLEDVIMIRRYDELYEKLHERVVGMAASDPDVMSQSRDVHMDKLINENYAFISERSSLQYMANQHCNMTLLTENFQAIQYALALRKGSAYTSLFSDSFLKLYATGFFDHWRERHFPYTTWCSVKTSSADPVTLLDMQGAFYLTGILLVICFVMLLAEVIHKKWKRKKCSYGMKINSANKINAMVCDKDIKLKENTKGKVDSEIKAVLQRAPYYRVRERVIHR